MFIEKAEMTALGQGGAGCDEEGRRNETCRVSNSPLPSHGVSDLTIDSNRHESKRSWREGAPIFAVCVTVRAQ